MSLVTTSGATNADSYAALAATDAYFAARGEATWTGIDADKEVALRRGTTYLENQYRDKWVGIRTGQYQSLAWPRMDGVRGYIRGFTQLLLDSDGWPIPQDVIPQQIITATMEAALLFLTGVTLEPRLVRGGQIKSQSTGVGPLSKSVTYMDGAPSIDRFTAIEGILRGLVTGTPGASSGTVRLVRA